MRRRLEGSIKLPSGKVLLSLLIDLATGELAVTLTRVDAGPITFEDLDPQEAMGVELAAFKNLWLHVARTDPTAMTEIAAIEARAAELRAAGKLR